MSSDDKQNDWSQDPSLSGIDFARLQALQQMASQSRGKSKQEAAKIDQMVRLFRSAASGKKR